MIKLVPPYWDNKSLLHLPNPNPVILFSTLWLIPFLPPPFLLKIDAFLMWYDINLIFYKSTEYQYNILIGFVTDQN